MRPGRPAEVLPVAMPADCDYGALSERLAAGDPEAFTSLFQRFADPLARYVFQYLGSRPEAEDVVAEAFQELWMRRGEADVQRDPEAALYGLARHRALDIQQARASESGPRPPYVPPTFTAHGPIVPAGPNTNVTSDEIDAMIQRAVSTLDPREREALRLRGQKASDKEIAAALGIARSAVAPLLDRAVDNLVRALPRSLG